MSAAAAPAAHGGTEAGAASASTTLTVGVDVGGTKVAAGIVDETGKLLATLMGGESLV